MRFLLDNNLSPKLLGLLFSAGHDVLHVQTSPSFLLIRKASGRRAGDQAPLILNNLDTIAEDLVSGAIVVLGESRGRHPTRAPASR